MCTIKPWHICCGSRLMGWFMLYFSICCNLSLGSLKFWTFWTVFRKIFCALLKSCKTNNLTGPSKVLSRPLTVLHLHCLLGSWRRFCKSGHESRNAWPAYVKLNLKLIKIIKYCLTFILCWLLSLGCGGLPLTTQMLSMLFRK